MFTSAPQITIQVRELLEKMEKSLEGQLVSLLKHHRIVDNYSPESALASLPPIPHVFAHIFRHKEWSGSMESTAGELLEDLFGNNRLDDVDAFLAELESSCDLNGAQGERPRRHAEPDFCSFVNNAISNLRKSDTSSSKTSSTRDTMFEFPKLKHFINAGKSVYRALLEERNFDFTSVAQMINAEVLLEEEATDECVSKAKGVYEQELKKGALSAFSKQEHEEKDRDVCTGLASEGARRKQSAHSKLRHRSDSCRPLKETRRPHNLQHWIPSHQLIWNCARCSHRPVGLSCVESGL